MQRPFLPALLFAVSLVALGHAQADSVDEPAPVILGALYNLTGIQAELDVPSSRGARLAVTQTNRNGGLLGRPVQLVLEDGQSMRSVVADKTAGMLQRFPAVSAFLGLSDTDMVLAAAPVAAASRRVFLTSGATSPRLPAEVSEYLFLACFGDNVQAAAAAEWAYRDLSARTVAILFNGSESYTRLLHGYFRTRFEQLGGRVVSVEPYSPDDIDRPIQRLQKADLVFLAAESPDGALTAVRLLREAGFSVPILGGDGFDSAELWSKHPAVDGFFFTTHAYLGPDNPDPRVAAFVKAYGDAYPGSMPDAFSALGYDAAGLLMTAIAKAESPEPAEVLEALAGIRQYQGISGTIRYSAGSRIPIKTVTILEIEQGQRKLVEQFVPERVPAP